MNLDDFSYEENGRRYIDPNVSLNEQNDFIQKLRDTQTERNAQIAQQTHDLGTDVPSNLGGLTGSEAYFNSRYQTPQTNSIVADLRTTAQAQALNDALNNELAKAKKRYSDAYNAAKSRANSSGSNGGGSTTEGEVEFKDNGPQGEEMSLEEVDPNNAEGEALDTIISQKEAELRSKQQVFDNVKKRTGIRGEGGWEDVGYTFEGLFTDWGKWSEIQAQQRRRKEINDLQKEIDSLKQKRGY